MRLELGDAFLVGYKQEPSIPWLYTIKADGEILRDHYIVRNPWSGWYIKLPDSDQATLTKEWSQYFETTEKAIDFFNHRLDHGESCCEVTAILARAPVIRGFVTSRG